MKSIIGYKNAIDNVVRIKDATGFWKLNTVEDKTKGTYQILGNPDGSVPA